MKRAVPQDKKQVVDILSAAFYENKSVNYILAQDGRKLNRIRHLMGYAFEMCSMFGQVYLSNDRKACALFVFPELKKHTFKSVWLDIKLIFNVVGFFKLKPVLQREGEIKAIQPLKRMAYLWFIGVDPNFQHTGIGKKLMDGLIEIMEKENRPIYLETSTIENLPWYKKFDFEIYHTLNLSYQLFFLRRN